MTDTSEGSSSAAHRAQEEDEASQEAQPRSVLGRLFGGWSAQRGEGEDDAPEQTVESYQPDRPGILNLRRMRLEDVAIPKAEITAVPSDIKKDDLVQVFRDSGLSRLPVFKGTLDTPVGMLHLKDLALQYGFNGRGKAAERFSIRKMLRPLIYAPPSMPIGVLLQKMQAERIHMALMIDEYGGVDGLVTIEDLIEQVLGEIEDEHDLEEDRYWTVEKSGSYLAQARTPLEIFEAEVGRRLNVPEAEEDVDTLGGLVFVLIGRVPARGEVINHPDGAEFEVVDADPRRIKRLRVRFPEEGQVTISEAAAE